jgi:uncharacterized protein YjiS (DUF1127 family)
MRAAVDNAVKADRKRSAEVEETAMVTSFLAETWRAMRADPPWHGARAWLAHGASWLAVALEVRRQRRDLAALDDALLKDLGLSRSDVARETERPFWDLPRIG